MQTSERTLDHIWQRLESAVDDRDADFRTPSLATLSESGHATSRIVVLRHALRTAGQLHFHSDSRCAKIRELVANPVATLLFHDRRAGVQLRATAEIRLHHRDAVAHETWRQLHDRARRVYHAAATPGSTEITSGQTLDERSARENFCVLIASLRTMDWLQLHEQGNRRMVFEAGDRGWTGKAVAP